MQLPKGKFPYIIGLICAAVVIFAMFVLPSRTSGSAADSFAAPLFQHEMPEGSRLIQTSAAKNEDGSTGATIILQSEWAPEEIQAFYEDTTYAPAAENETVTLSVLPLGEDSIEVLKEAELYEEDGGSYWFVYLCSIPADTP